MKKITLALFLCFMLFTLSVFASESGASYGDVPSTTENITVDAVKDDIYAKGLNMTIDRLLDPAGNDYGTRGNAYLLIKDNSLYIYVDVTTTDIIEPTSDLQTSTPWNTESVEVFINEGNTDDNAVTVQYRIDTTGWPCVYTQGGQADYGADMVGDEFGYAAAITSTGYAVEFRIPLTTYSQGTKVGFQFQINDPNDAGQIQVMSRSSLTASSWTAELYDYITIGAPIVIETEAPVTEAPAQTPAAETAAPTAAQTGDIAICAAIFGLAAAAAIFIASKKTNK
jgi:Domain of unknown function (DUF1083).